VGKDSLNWDDQLVRDTLQNIATLDPEKMSEEIGNYHADFLRALKTFHESIYGDAKRSGRWHKSV
jgi:hypothetical protein